MGWGKTQSIQCTSTFDLYHQVIIRDRDFDLNTYIMYLILSFELQELSSSLQSLMFELEENPVPTKTIDSIMEKIARIIEITIDYHWGGLSHYIYTIESGYLDININILCIYHHSDICTALCTWQNLVKGIDLLHLEL